MTKTDISLSEAIEVLQSHLSADKSEGSYYYGWQANIAMAIHDELSRYKEKNWLEVIPKNAFAQHDFFNDAAKRFLETLIASELPTTGFNIDKRPENLK